MKFRCERDVFVEALAACGRAASTRGGSLPSLACIQFDLAGDVLTLTATDLVVSVQWSFTVAGERDGSVLLPGRLMADVVKSLPAGAVTVDSPDVPALSVSVVAGRSDFQIRAGILDDFPRLSWPSGPPSTIPAKELAAALTRVVPAASSDDSRPILCGVLLEELNGGLRVVGTDSYRLAYQDMPNTALFAEQGRALVPARALAEVVRLVDKGWDVDVRLEERRVSFEAGPLRLATSLIEGDYPKYGGLIPKSHAGRLTANRQDLLDVVKQVRVMARESTPVRFTLGGTDLLSLGATTMDVGSSTATLDGATYEGPELVVAFNPEYLADALEACPGDTVHVDVVDGRQPALVRSPTDESFLTLLMPVRVS